MSSPHFHAPSCYVQRIGPLHARNAGPAPRCGPRPRSGPRGRERGGCAPLGARESVSEGGDEGSAALRAAGGLCDGLHLRPGRLQGLRRGKIKGGSMTC